MDICSLHLQESMRSKSMMYQWEASYACWSENVPDTPSRTDLGPTAFFHYITFVSIIKKKSNVQLPLQLLLKKNYSDQLGSATKANTSRDNKGWTLSAEHSNRASSIPWCIMYQEEAYKRVFWYT